MLIHHSSVTHRPGCETVRTIVHVSGSLYLSQIREISPAYPAGRIVGGSPSQFTLVDGVARWVSNGSVLMRDVIRDHAIDQVPGFDRVAHEAARETEISSFVAAYRRHQPAAPSAEEVAEARAAFGPGRDVVDVLTGRKFTT